MAEAGCAPRWMEIAPLRLLAKCALRGNTNQDTNRSVFRAVNPTSFSRWCTYIVAASGVPSFDPLHQNASNKMSIMFTTSVPSPLTHQRSPLRPNDIRQTRVTLLDGLSATAPKSPTKSHRVYSRHKCKKRLLVYFHTKWT